MVGNVYRVFFGGGHVTAIVERPNEYRDIGRKDTRLNEQKGSCYVRVFEYTDINIIPGTREHRPLSSYDA